MGFSFVYCVVCGCPFDIPPAEEPVTEDRWKSDDPLEDETKQWMCRIRLIGATASLERFATPPFRMPKNESRTKGFFLSEPADWAITDGLYFRLGQDPFRVLASAKDSGDVLFPLHENCLIILQRAIAWRIGLTPEPGPPVPSLVRAYKALCAQYARNVAEKARLSKKTGFYGSSDYMDYGLEFEHDYEGAREFWASEGWTATRGNEWYCNDPIDISHLARFLSGQVQETIPSKPIAAVDSAEEHTGTAVNVEASMLDSATSSGLEALPLEIWNHIIAFLPTTSAVLQLRRCCKAFASRISVDQQFWLKHLREGRAVPYLWDLRDLGETKNDQVHPMVLVELSRRDWKGLAQSLVQRNITIQTNQGPLESTFWSFKNRDRIFRLAQRLLELPVD
ncbi:hypothetical protein B0J13DRAFT_622189 [Dactylonectria estremocensis]|uniref:F-box domain-containing protein n=1 Tax=Dactylonectria estremocensis TaxID=1079267 RepID=A0A9P9J1M0_9HYPO|nr:hypothetical protein B0J13DRAFT_622189 [Dactylonectria estremocensis]